MISRLAVAAIVFASALVPACANDCVIPRERHAWGAFRPGSWKQVRVTSENVNDRGEVVSRSVTETKSLLLAADDDGFELQVDVIVDVAGKRFASESRVSRQGYQGEPAGQRFTLRRRGDEMLRIDGHERLAHVSEIDVQNESGHRLARYFVSEQSPAYVLRRESVTYDAMNKPIAEGKSEVVAQDVPYDILGRRRFTWKVRTVHETDRGRTVTDEFHSPDVPGGVVAHTQEEFDSAGKLLRRGKLELINYGVATSSSPPPHRVPRRVRRAEERMGKRE